MNVWFGPHEDNTLQNVLGIAGVHGAEVER